MKIKIIRNPDPLGASIHPFLLATPEGEVIHGCTGFSIEFGVDHLPRLTARFVEFSAAELEGKFEVFLGEMKAEPPPAATLAPPASAPDLSSCADFPGGVYPAVREDQAGKVAEVPKVPPLLGKCNLCGFAAATGPAGHLCTSPACPGMVMPIGLPVKEDLDIEDMDPIR